jgi:hypothetical protein
MSFGSSCSARDLNHSGVGERARSWAYVGGRRSCRNDARFESAPSRVRAETTAQTAKSVARNAGSWASLPFWTSRRNCDQWKKLNLMWWLQNGPMSNWLNLCKYNPPEAQKELTLDTPAPDRG